MKRLSDPTFRYYDSAKSSKPGYLARKWNRLFPGWRSGKSRVEKLATVAPIRKRA